MLLLCCVRSSLNVRMSYVHCSVCKRLFKFLSVSVFVADTIAEVEIDEVQFGEPDGGIQSYSKEPGSRSRHSMITFEPGGGGDKEVVMALPLPQ